MQRQPVGVTARPAHARGDHVPSLSFQSLGTMFEDLECTPIAHRVSLQGNWSSQQVTQPTATPTFSRLITIG